MSVHAQLSRLALVLVSLGVSTPALAGWVGINGVSCDFDNMQDAIDAASPGGTIRVAQGLHSDPGFVMDKDLQVLRANSACQTGGTVNAILDFNGVGHGEISDEVVATFDDVSFTEGVGTYGGNLLVGSDADVTIRDTLITSGEADFGGGIAVFPGASLSVYGAWIGNNVAGSGGGIYAVDADMLLSDSATITLRIYSNTADYLGGALDLWGGTLSVVGSPGAVAFEDNRSLVPGTDSRGGAIYLQEGAATIEEASFSGNEASYGGAIAAQEGVLSLYDVTVHENSANERGGGVLVSSSELLVEDSAFTANSAPRGGALYTDGAVAPLGYTAVYRSVFDGNTATAGTTGSAIDARGALNGVDIYDSLLVRGTSVTAPGAAIVAQDAVPLSVIDSTIANNSRWGVVAASSALVSASGSIIWGNSAGGVTVTGGGTGSATCSDVQGLTPAGTNISVNPQFVSPATGNFQLGGASPARNQCSAHAGTSLDGNSRAGGASDMGAYNN